MSELSDRRSSISMIAERQISKKREHEMMEIEKKNIERRNRTEYQINKNIQ